MSGQGPEVLTPPAIAPETQAAVSDAVVALMKEGEQGNKEAYGQAANLLNYLGGHPAMAEAPAAAPVAEARVAETAETAEEVEIIEPDAAEEAREELLVAESANADDAEPAEDKGPGLFRRGMDRARGLFGQSREGSTKPRLGLRLAAAGTAVIAATALAVSTNAPNKAIAAVTDREADDSPDVENTRASLKPAYDNFGPFSDKEIRQNVVEPDAESAMDSHSAFIDANPRFAANTAYESAYEAHQKWAYKKLLGDVPNGKAKHDAALEKALYESEDTIQGTLVADYEVVDYDAQKDGGVADQQRRIFMKGKRVLGITAFDGEVPKGAVMLPVDTDGDGKADTIVAALRDLGDGEMADYSPIHEVGCFCPKPSCGGGKPQTGSPPTGNPPTGSPPTGSPPETGNPPTGSPPTGSPPETGNPPTNRPPKKTPPPPPPPSSGKDASKSPVSSDPNDSNEETRPNIPAPDKAIQPEDAPEVDPYTPPETVEPPADVGPTEEEPADDTPVSPETTDGRVTSP